MRPSEAIKIIKELIRSVELVYKANPLTDKEPHPATDALTLAISALEKQSVDKCCETCKYERLELDAYPCSDCIRAKDHYEPHTEEEV